MHRSGTSAMARVLGLCGATLPRHTMAAHESNALGHWEPQRVVDTHDAFLADAGTAWDEARDYPDTIFASPAAVACRRKLADIVRDEYGNTPLFVLKDPRTSRLMPLWRPVLTALGAMPHVVIMVRNPLEVAGSLKQRNGWSDARGLTIWLRYLLRAERDTRDLPRCFVSYDQLISDWPAAVAKLSSQLDIQFLERDAATDREIDRFVRRGLRHHQRNEKELLRRADVPDCVKQAYLCVSAAVETGIVDYAAMDAVAAALDSAEHALEEVRQTARATESDLGSPAKRDALLALALAEFDRVRGKVERSERMLRDMRTSWSWRLTRPFRAVGRAVARLRGGLKPAS